jgi:hypothetical protein
MVLVALKISIITTILPFTSYNGNNAGVKTTSIDFINSC